MKTKKMLDIEEALSEIWKYRELSEKKKEKIKEVLDSMISKEVFEDLLAQDFIRIERGHVELTPEGEKAARDVTRRQRLAERLLVDVIEVKQEDMDKVACEFEHIISEDVADAICTLLGHPKVCPHGSPIPEGPCCSRIRATIEPVVAALDQLAVGEKARVAYIVTSEHPHLHKLLSLGIVPGTEIHLHQKAPSYVINVGETQIALDHTVATHIYVRKS